MKKYLDKDFIKDLEYIYIDHLYEMDYKEALILIMYDLDNHEIEDIEEETFHRMDYIEELEKTEDLDSFFDKVSYIETSIADDEDILENCKTKEAKDLFVGKSSDTALGRVLKDVEIK